MQTARITDKEKEENEKQKKEMKKTPQNQQNFPTILSQDLSMWKTKGFQQTFQQHVEISKKSKQSEANSPSNIQEGNPPAVSAISAVHEQQKPNNKNKRNARSRERRL